MQIIVKVIVALLIIIEKCKYSGCFFNILIEVAGLKIHE